MEKWRLHLLDDFHGENVVDVDAAVDAETVDALAVVIVVVDASSASAVALERDEEDVAEAAGSDSADHVEVVHSIWKSKATKFGSKNFVSAEHQCSISWILINFKEPYNNVD